MAAEIQQTNFNLPGQIGEVYHGKVGDAYTIEHEIGELIVVVRTDRISAFDFVLPEPIPSKGRVLNQMSAELLTRSTVPNWLLASPDPNVSVGLKANPFKVEMIRRKFLLGSAWKAYDSKGAREICGNHLPDHMTEFQPFDDLLLTPTTKAYAGHDEDTTHEEIVASGLATEEEYAEMSRLSFDLFAEGQAMANEKGLLLADTKYEFGRLATGQLVVIDEIHTPDSSRYFPLDQYNAYLEGQTDQRPEQLSKEFVREWLIKRGFDGKPGQVVPHLPDEFRTEVSERYIDLFQRMMGRPFEAASEASEAAQLDRIQTNITRCLGQISLA
jgi:phosphoribosylaminoimidazole-succinocarboxamide synthase